MKDLKRAFGTPDPEFHERVKQTLFQIEEKEEARVKKKLTLSMALAFALCICIVTVSAFAGTQMFTGKPDVTQTPLSQSENKNPNNSPLNPQATPLPELTIALDAEIYWQKDTGNIFHLNKNCGDISYPYTVTTLSAALEAGGEACPICFSEVPSFSTLPRLATESPYATITPQPSPMPVLPTPIPNGNETLSESALQATVTPIPMASSDLTYIWSAEGDSCYHTDRECSRLTGTANRALLAVAQNRMQSPCPLCVNTVASTPTPMPTYMPQATQVPGTEAAPTELAYPTPTPMIDDADNPLVYVEQDRITFHYVSSLACTDRVGTLTSMPLTDALNEGALPCRECLVCWIGEGSNLYHMSETCSRLKSAQLQLLNTAVQADYDPCGLCVRFFDLNNAKHHRVAWCSVFGDGVNAYIPCSLSFPYLVGSAPCELCLGNESYPIATSTPMPTSEPITGYYYTADDWYCHADLSCFGKIDTTVSTASMENLIAMGKRACEDCMEPFSYYYSASDNYYHTFECAQIADEQAEALPEDELLSLGKRDCPWCLGWYNYYSSAEDGRYHKASSCDQHFGTAAFHSTEAELIEMGKKPCPVYLPIPYYTTESDANFHADHTCAANQASIITGSLEDMLSLGKTPCQVCVDPDALAEPESEPAIMPYPELTYYWLPDKTTFHSDMNCCGMESPLSGSLAEAVSAQKDPCPICLMDQVYVGDASRYFHYLSGCYGTHDLHLTDAALSAAAGTHTVACPVCVQPLYWFYPHKTEAYPYFHTRIDCPDMSEEQAVPGTYPQTVLCEKELCPSCADGLVYCTENGVFYHSFETCSGMSAKLAEPITARTASILGKTACPVCMVFNAESTPEPAEEPVQVFSTRDGTFYHTVPDCSGTKNAESVPLAIALNRNQTACPVCTGEGSASPSTSIVYLWDSNAPVYHSVFDCSGFEYRTQMDIDHAAAQEKIPCPECVNTEENVWYTAESKYYHSYQHYAYLNLPNMIESSPMKAIAAGKRACINCMLTETAKTKVSDVPAQIPPAWSAGESACFFYDYSQNHSEALHFRADCEAMQSPVAISFETAVKYDLWHCDLCSEDYYRHDCIVQKDDTVYHLSDTCGEFFGADRITRWDALLRGLEPCPSCAWEDVSRTGPLPTVPPQPTAPPSDNQDALKAWLPSESEQAQCLADLGVFSN